MSIPKYEMNNLQQEEFWKFKKDELCVGLPGQKVNLPYIDQLFMRLDKLADQREDAKNV